MNSALETTLAAVAAVLLPFGAAHAGDPAATPGIDKRQANQERRIDKGIASGALTAKEARRLDRQQDRIDTAENKAKADGVVTRNERHRLHHAQSHANRSIYRQKHDRQAAPN